MKRPVYCVRDLKVGFNAPYVEIGDDSAIRGFAYQINNNDFMGFTPSDYELYYVGEFDVDKGTIVGLDIPTLVSRGNEVFNKT